MRLSVEQVHRFCQGREVEIVIVPPPKSYSLCLHGEYDGYGDFFSILVNGVQYLDVTSGMIVGQIVFDVDVRRLLTNTSRWSGLKAEFADSGMVIVAADSEGYLEASLLVATELHIVAGKDWV